MKATTDGERCDSCCLACGETLRWYGDGYGHMRGWCKEGL